MTSGGVADVVPSDGTQHPGPAGGPGDEPGVGPATTQAAAASGAGTATQAAAERRRDRRWAVALVAICALALGIRVGYVFGWQQLDSIGGDARYYHVAANLLADGEGFAHPFFWEEGIRAPGADHPPAYQMALAVPSLLGLDSIRAHQLFTCLLGTVTVALAGIAGRRIAGRLAGLVAALLTATYPNVWMNDAAVMSETLALLFGVVVIIAAYAAWRRPDWRTFAWTGVAVGFASLSRAEAVMLIPLLLWPLALWARGLQGWRVRLGRLAVATGAAVLVLLPWVAYNMRRFEEPTTLSTQLGPTLDVANCSETYYGPALGSWSFGCASDPVVPDNDRSRVDKTMRDEAITYARAHLDRVPVVVAARFGRAWAVYKPIDQLRFDKYAENRPLSWSRVGLAMYYVLVPAAAVGAVLLRKRGVPSFPLVAGLVNVAITVVVFYGSTRFRAPAEPSIVLLAAVAIAALAQRLRPAARRAAAGDAPPAAAGVDAQPDPVAGADASPGTAAVP